MNWLIWACLAFITLGVLSNTIAIHFINKTLQIHNKSFAIITAFIKSKS
jgi:hypothetical protein